MDKITLDNAIRCVEEARRELRALYLSNPMDEVEVAETPIPPQYEALARPLHAAHEHLLNLRDFAAS